jgi:potassium-dependent mechanosensitive channel
VLFAIWNALKAAKIEIPYPHRVIEIKSGALPQ